MHQGGGGGRTSYRFVSMKSGLEDRNNRTLRVGEGHRNRLVSMKSGLEDRNNQSLRIEPVVLGPMSQ